MAEDYSNPKFNSYNDFSSDQDNNCLYVRNIPSSLSREDFIALMSEGGRKVIRSKLYEPKGETTIGLITFESSKEAGAALSDLNRKPPLNLNISYSRKKDGASNPNDSNRHVSRSQGIPQNPPPPIKHNPPPQRLSSPLIPKIGRGNLSPQKLSSPVIPSVGRGNSPHPTQNNPQRQQISSPLTPNNGRGRGKILEAASMLSALKIVVDGNRRTATILNTESCAKEQESSEPLDIPKLVANPFLTCSVCSGAGTYVCDICKKPYCSQKCQIADWPKHKSICTSNENLTKKPQGPLKNSRDSSYVSDGSSSDDKADKVSTSFQSKRFSLLNHADKSGQFVQVDKCVKISEIERSVLPIGAEVLVSVCYVDNPSKFFVQHSTSKKVLSEMEKDILLTQKSPANCAVGIVCCTDHKGSMKRVNILKEMANQKYLVQFIDYGYTSDIPKAKLFNLPDVFKQVSIQAICCKLVEIGGEKKDSWTDEETDTFKHYISQQEIFKAKVQKFLNGAFEVILNNEDGISLYSIMNTVKMTTELGKDKSAGSSSSKELVPSVLSTLTNGSVVGLVGIVWESDKFFAVLDDGNTFEETEAIEKELQNLNTKEVNLYVEEGDIVAGLSVEHKQYFRCMVLKRTRNSFLVQYLDYGDKEEISKLRELTPNLLKKRCSIVCCLNPISVKADILRNIFQSKQNVIVKKLNSCIKLVYDDNGVAITLDCYPWNYKALTPERGNLCQQKETNPPNAVSQPNSALSHVETSQTLAANKELSENPIKIEDIPNKSLKTGNKYCVKPVIGTASNLFIQFKEDEKDLLNMNVKLQEYCMSSVITSHKPKKNEVVCCKYKDDGYWYRGLVFSKKLNLYTVSFIDFGNNDELTEELMKPLPKNLATPKLSMCVSLQDIKNEDLEDEELQIKLTNEYFDMEVVELSVSPVQVKLSQGGIYLAEFVKSINRSKSLLNFIKLPNEKSEVVICYIDKDEIYLYQTKEKHVIEKLVNEVNTTINKMDVVKKVVIDHVYCALCSDGLWYRACIDKQLSPNQYRVTFIDFGNQEDINTKQLRKLPNELFKIPVHCIPAIPKNIKCSQLELEKQYLVEAVDVCEKSGVQIINFQVEEKAALPKVTDLKKQILSIDTITEVKVSHVEGGDLFYLQMTSDNQIIETLESKLKCASDFESVKGLPEVGSLICAKYSGEWFRGSIEAIKSDTNSCQVCYIDYGNTEIVSIENMKILPSELVSFPIFSIPAQIKNIDTFYGQLQTGASTFSVKALDVTQEGIQIIEVVVPKTAVVSIEPLLLTDLPTDVVACHQENDIFYVQKVCDKNKLQEMMLALQSNLTPITHSPCIGELLCVKYVDSLWYRGQIKRDCGGNNFSVHFVDYGNTEIVNSKDMCDIPLSFSTLPMFSVPVKVGNGTVLKIDEEYIIKRISLLEGNIHVVKVRPQVKPVLLSSLKQSILQENITSVSILTIDGTSHHVTKCSDSSNLEELMAALNNYGGIAVFETPKIGEVYIVKRSDGKWHRGCIKATKNTDICEVFLMDCGITENISCSNICYISDKLISYPIFSIKVLFSSSPPQSFSAGEKVNVVLESKSTDPPTVRIHNPHMISSLNRQYLPIETAKNILVCYVENDIAFVLDIDLSQKLGELTNELLNVDSLKNLIYKPAIGELLVGQSNTDNAWYRCCIEDIISCDKYKVKFIDYGNSEELSKDRLRCISDRLVSFPPLCNASKLINSKGRLEVDKQYMVRAVNIPNSNEPQLIQLASENSLEVSAKADEPMNKEIVNTEPTRENVFTIDKLKYVDFPAGEQTIFASTVPINDNEEVYIFCSPLNSENLMQLNQLNFDANEYCNSSKAVSYKNGEIPKNQDMVLAKYEGEWCRAAIIDEIDETKFEVFYVDYGNTETVNIDCIRKMEAKFMGLERQVHLCLLSGVKVEERNREQARKEIMDNFINVPLTGTFITNGSVISQIYINNIVQHLKSKSLIA